MKFLDAYIARATPRADVARATPSALSPETQRGRVLRAVIAECEARGASEVPESAVAVRAWQLWPDEFSLTGYPYPDPMPVRSRLSQGEVLVRDGYVTRPELGRVRITAKGRAWGDRCREPGSRGSRDPRATERDPKGTTTR